MAAATAAGSAAGGAYAGEIGETVEEEFVMESGSAELIEVFGKEFWDKVLLDVQEVLDYERAKHTVRDYTRRNVKLYLWCCEHCPGVCFKEGYDGPGRDPMKYKPTSGKGKKIVNLLDYTKVTTEVFLGFLSSLRNKNGNICSAVDVRKYKNALMLVAAAI